MNIEKVGPVGAEITGIDLSISQNIPADKIIEACLKYSVLIFKNQDLNPISLSKIALIWGQPLIHPVFKGIEGYPEIIKIQNLGEKYHTNAHWHSDVTFEEEPPDATLLYSLEVPKEGGDTLFSSQYLAYEELDADLKTSLVDKKAVHTNAGVLMLSGGDPKKAKTVEHPIFREHPETGKKALYVTEAFVQSIKGFNSKESQEILRVLYKRACNEQYIYRHKWLRGDLVVWDNRSTQHFAEHGYGDQTRTMHRLTTSGSKPF